MDKPSPSPPTLGESDKGIVPDFPFGDSTPSYVLPSLHLDLDEVDEITSYEFAEVNSEGLTPLLVGPQRHRSVAEEFKKHDPPPALWIESLITTN